jgi:hypothetical protein
MANRTYLYITDSSKREKIRGIGEYNYDFPLLFKMLCSSSPTADKSSIYILEEKTAITADMYEGIERTEKFLLKMKDMKILSKEGKILVTEQDCESIINFLDKDKFLEEGYNYFLFEGLELYQMSAESYQEFADLTIEDIGKINEAAEEVKKFMETGMVSEKLYMEIGSYEKFRYELKCFSEYLYYDFSGENCEDSAEYEKTENITEIYKENNINMGKRLMSFERDVIMFMTFFLLIFPPIGIYFCYDGFKNKYDDRYTSGIILGVLGTGLTVFYLWKIFSFLGALF